MALNYDSINDLMRTTTMSMINAYLNDRSGIKLLRRMKEREDREREELNFIKRFLVFEEDEQVVLI